MFWVTVLIVLLLMVAVNLGQVWMGCALGLALYLTRPSMMKIWRSRS